MKAMDYEELEKLRELVRHQQEMLAQKDAELEKQRIQIENLTQAVLHARRKMALPVK